MNPLDAFEAFYHLATAGINVAYQWVNVLPVSYAFGAGMLATMNPCGFVMLPAFGAFYVTTSGDEAGDTVTRRIGRALWMGVLVTAVFVLVFGIVGAIVTAGGRSVMAATPWAGLGIGVSLAGLGVFQLVTRRSLFANLTSGVRLRRARTTRGALAFGSAYAVCSLGCTLPIFLAVAGGVFTGRRGFADSMQRFIEYGLGMGAVLTVIVVGIAVARGQAVRFVRPAVPVAEIAANALLIFAGAYIIWYWTTQGLPTA